MLLARVNDIFSNTSGIIGDISASFYTFKQLPFFGYKFNKIGCYGPIRAELRCGQEKQL